MTPPPKECRLRHTGKALQNCYITAVLCKMMSSTRHVRELVLLLLQLGSQHYGTEKGNGVTWPFRKINLIQTSTGNLKW